MSPVLNGSSVIWHFERSNAIKIRDRIIFNFYMGLPHMYTLSSSSLSPSLLLPSSLRPSPLSLHPPSSLSPLPISPLFPPSLSPLPPSSFLTQEGHTYAALAPPLSGSVFSPNVLPIPGSPAFYHTLETPPTPASVLRYGNQTTYPLLKQILYFLSDTVATIFSLHVLVWLLFKGDIYFFRKPADINDDWIGAIQ